MKGIVAYLIPANVNILAGEQADDLLQDTFQEAEGALLAGAVHILMHAPVHRHLRHIT